MSTRDDVIRLIRRATLPPDTKLPSGATSSEIEELSFRYAQQFPAEFYDWLSQCNAPPIGPGGFYGVNPAPRWLLVETHLEQHPGWIEKQWIPVAGDGLGNYYVLDAERNLESRHPVYFIDHEFSFYDPKYVVASNLWIFLWFLLTDELKAERSVSRWPFNKSFVLNNDPDLKTLKGYVPLPWDAN